MMRLTMIVLLPLLALCLLGADAAVTSGIVKIVRNVDDEAIFTQDPAEAATARCNFAGDIVFSHPMSLHEADKFFATGQLQLKSMEMMVDYINTERCGIRMGGRNYSMTLSTYGDDSDKNKTRAIAEAAHNRTDFFFAGYSSGLTSSLSPVAQAHAKVLIAAGSSRTSVYEGMGYAFGTLPPSSQFLKQAIEGLAARGAKSIASVWEESVGSCDSMPDWAETFGLAVTSTQEVVRSPTMQDFAPIVRNVSQQDPDVMVTCVYDAGCAEWIRAMRKANWSPKAQVFTICFGFSSFEESAGSDVQYMMGATPWYRSLHIRDAITGWSASDYATKFEEYAFRNATYQSASAAAAVGILVQAIEKANTTNSTRVKDILATSKFTTLYGNVTFNADGQSQAPSLLVQYDTHGNVQTVYPSSRTSSEMLYPMPTWGSRDCTTGGVCALSGGVCMENGLCSCGSMREVSIGSGANATCKILPEEDMTYIRDPLKIVGSVLLALQVIMSCGAIVWTAVFRKRQVVSVSQPVFLVLIAFGCLMIASSIIPMGIQADYRYLKDDATGVLTDESNPNAAGVDRACMAVPWLYGIGFAITFSALFAKIWRVKLIFMGRQFARKAVAPKDVAIVMVVMVLIETIILLSWQLVSPFQWERMVLLTDSHGFTTKSVGVCMSDSGWWFFLALVTFHLLSLLYALFLCYITRKIPSEFAEGKWIAATIVSMLQIMVLAIPIIIMVMDNTDVFYFVRACVVFLQSATVTLLVFVPKMYRLHLAPEKQSRGMQRISSVRSSVRRSRSGPNSQSNPSMISMTINDSRTHRGSSRNLFDSSSKNLFDSSTFSKGFGNSSIMPGDDEDRGGQTSSSPSPSPDRAEQERVEEIQETVSSESPSPSPSPSASPSTDRSEQGRVEKIEQTVSSPSLDRVEQGRLENTQQTVSSPGPSSPSSPDLAEQGRVETIQQSFSSPAPLPAEQARVEMIKQMRRRSGNL